MYVCDILSVFKYFTTNLIFVDLFVDEKLFDGTLKSTNDTYLGSFFANAFVIRFAFVSFVPKSNLFRLKFPIVSFL